MSEAQSNPAPAKPAITDRNWIPILAKYWKPSMARSMAELFITIIPFFLCWAAAYWALSVSYWLTLALVIPTAGFMVRMFLIQHDCGHGAFFEKRRYNDWVGRFLGIFSLTPYFVWHKAHAIHHAGSGNLEKRGLGDISTLTVAEYQALTPLGRFGYRAYRHPLVLFGIGPAYNFWIRQRLPLGFMRAGWRYWVSAMGTNFAMLIVAAIVIYFIGFKAFLLVHLPITVIATSIGVWLFYVQHQFEDTYWNHGPDWELQDAALFGSSHYDLPGILRWFTANIGVHHVHHLNARIPYYRLPQILRDFPELANVRRLTLWQSLACVKLALWDENARKLVPIRSV
ncbi:MAG: fatty acid desaturase [Robiginitomaculum sp.]|nr:MAG: fatty acid desaturase [Robiginitomaculum sp.]